MFCEALFTIAAAARFGLLFRQNGFAGKLDLVAFLADTLNEDLLAFLQLVTHVFDAAVRDLRYVEQAVKARQDLDKRSEIDDTGNRTEIGFTDLGLSSQRLDPGDSSLSGISIGGCDQYRSVVFNVDLRSSFLCNRAN